MTNTRPERTSIAIQLVLATATLIASLGISISSVLLPALTLTFSATVSNVQWVVLAYLMSVTISIVSAGRLGDIFGHRRLLIVGLVIFSAASVLCALAPTWSLLVVGRALQGVGGAILIALSMSIARDLVPADRLGTAMDLLGTASAVGTALGASLGGMLLAWGDWRMAFWLLAGFAVATLLVFVRSTSSGVAPAKTSYRSLDLPGTLTLVIVLTTYALATSGGANEIPASPLALICGTLVAVILFVIVETRAESPLVPMELLRDRTVGTGFVMNILIGAVMMSVLVVSPFFLVYSLGLHEALFGLVMAIGPLVAALSGVPAGRLTDLFGVDRMTRLALAQTTLGLLCLAFLPRYFGVGGFVAALVMLTPAFQLFLAAKNTAVLVGAAAKQRGRPSGLLGLSRNLGLMTGTSVMSTLFVSILGTGNAADEPSADIAHAYSLTFVSAAGLAVVALGLAVFSTKGPATGCTSPAR